MHAWLFVYIYILFEYFSLKDNNVYKQKGTIRLTCWSVIDVAWRVQSMSRSFACLWRGGKWWCPAEECVYETSNHTQYLFPLPSLAVMESSIIENGYAIHTKIFMVIYDAHGRPGRRRRTRGRGRLEAAGTDTCSEKAREEGRAARADCRRSISV